jgi:hypothetical protein
MKQLLIILSVCVLIISCAKEETPSPKTTRHMRVTSSVNGLGGWIKVQTIPGIKTISVAEAIGGYESLIAMPGIAEYQFEKTSSHATGVLTVTVEGDTVLQINAETIFEKENGTFEVP